MSITLTYKGRADGIEHEKAFDGRFQHVECYEWIDEHIEESQPVMVCGPSGRAYIQQTFDAAVATERRERAA